MKSEPVNFNSQLVNRSSTFFEGFFMKISRVHTKCFTKKFAYAIMYKSMLKCRINK